MTDERNEIEAHGITSHRSNEDLKALDDTRIAISTRAVVTSGAAGIHRRETARSRRNLSLLKGRVPLSRPPIKTIPESIFARKISGLIDGEKPTTGYDDMECVIKYYFAGQQREEKKQRRKKKKIFVGAEQDRRAFVNVINHRSSRGIDQFTVSGINRRRKLVAAVYRLITILRELSPVNVFFFCSYVILECPFTRTQQLDY